MEKLGVSFGGGGGGGASRKALEATVEAQRRELAQYQARLGDVVRAYKGLLKEKAALEAALGALTPSPEVAPPSESPSESPPEPESESESPECEAARLRARLATLSAALATVAQEKARMEASFRADRRQAREEAEEALREAGEERARLAREAAEARERLAETRERLAAAQQEREREQGDHAAMLRELQRLLQDERSLRREADRGREEAREALAARAEREEPRAPREESDGPDSRLQAEQAALRSHFQAQLAREAGKAAQAEERVQMEERRVASLEAQVSEISELLGSYEKAKQKDQMTIQKLKDRLVQLDLENKTLAIAASGHSTVDIALEDSNMDINVLKDRMEKLRKLLRVATKHSPPPRDMDIEAFCTEDGDGEKATAAYYQQELKQLKEEFERYKLRAQVVLKNKSTKDGNLAKELEDTQEQLAELKKKYIALRLSCEEAAKQHLEEMEAKRQEGSHLQHLHKQELERCQLDYQEKVLRLEEEMCKQRDRALAVLAEKDQELEQLRVLLLPYYRIPECKQGAVPGPLGGNHGSKDEDNCLESFTQVLRLSATQEPSLLLYTEQVARKEVELLALKKQKHKLEVEVHQLQERLLEEREKHREEVSALQGHIQKNFRDQSREGANLEYLKNIFYRFLTLTDLLGRQQTLRAILTILHFSPEEKQTVLSHLGGSSSWWHPAKR